MFIATCDWLVSDQNLDILPFIHICSLTLRFNITSVLSYSFAVSVNTCTVLTVDNADQNPQSSTIDFDTNLIYTCKTGYSHTGGNLTRSCKADGSLTRSIPVCTGRFARNTWTKFEEKI